MNSRVFAATLGVSAVFLLASSSATAQVAASDATNPPWKAEAERLQTPRTSDGKPNLSGLWERANNRFIELLGGRGDYAALGGGLASDEIRDTKGNVKASWGGRGNDGAGGFINYQRDSGTLLRAEPNMPVYKPEHWDRVQWLDENGNQEDPELGCQPLGVPRMGPPDRIVQTPKELLFFYRNYNTFRAIPMNKALPPVADWEGVKWYGVSTARWEGDTLVVESVDFSENSWLGFPGYFHSADMKVIERFTRKGNVLTWQATVEDPVFLQPWVQNPWYLRMIDAEAIGFPKEQEPCKDLSREHIQTKERG